MEKHSLGARRQGRSGGGRFSGAVHVAFATLFVLGAAAASHATPYWIAWEGDDWPENQAWEHVAFNYFGGPVAERTLQAGQMEINGLASIGIADVYQMDRPSALDPQAGEVFVVQWRLRVDDVVGTGLDPSIAIFSDEGFGVSLRFGVDKIAFAFESYVVHGFTPYTAHTYELRSEDMRSYDLFIDGAHVRTGAFRAVVTQSHVAWGDGGIGSASRSNWDYFRFGVVPEPPTLALTSLAFYGSAWFRRR